MTAIFRPPRATIPAVGWPKLFGLAQGRDPFWARLREQQLAGFDRHVPLLGALVACDCCAVVWLAGAAAEPIRTLGWAMLFVFTVAVWIFRWRQQRVGPRAVQPTIADFWLVSGEVATFGLAWSAVAWHLLPTLGVDDQIALVLLSAATMAVVGFAAATLPVAAVAIVLGIGTTTLACVPPWSPLATPVVMLAWPAFTVLVAGMTGGATKRLAVRLRRDAEAAESSALLGMRLSELETNGSDWLIELDAQGRFSRVSPRLCDAARRPAAALLGQPLAALAAPDRRDAAARGAVRTLIRQIAARAAFDGLILPVVVRGEPRWWSLSASANYSGDRFAGFCGVGRDITDSHLATKRIAELARHDPLTGLANRALLRELVADALAGPGCAVLLVDLDRFRLVNEAHGQLAGDALLRSVAMRLRELAGPTATVGRLGSDEFAVLLGPADVGDVAVLARQIVRSLSSTVSGGSTAVGASVGYALGPRDGASADEMMLAARLALDEAKRSGGATARRFKRVLRSRAEERRALEVDLALALDRGELSLDYQPIVDAADERIIGFEALLRWRHPVLGPISPLKFIPVAEANGAIMPIGTWVLRAACAEAARWPKHIRLAVNLSTVQFNDPGLPATVARALADHGIVPDRLELEITESVFLSDRPATTAMIARLRALGVRFALDDFGTGYSALGYLRRNAFSRIKIDRSFVQRAAALDTESTAIIRAIVGLADSLGMATTAEGTETRAEFEACRTLGCAQVQGYLFGRPMPAGEAAALVGVAASD